MAAFSEGKVSSFAYDPEISTVPSQTLTAYSLTENDILRQAIIRYQGANPDVYVEYKVGMDEEGSVTREDAVPGPPQVPEKDRPREPPRRY